jgi:hypothetical protein
MRAPRYQCFSHQVNNRQPWQLNKSKSWQLFWNYVPAKQQCQYSPFTSKMSQMG